MNQIQHRIGKGLLFATAMWLCSRVVICIAMLLIAPKLPAPELGQVAKFGWDAFYYWDSIWYHRLVVVGYEYVNDGKQYSVAFFPLFPLLIWCVMKLGLPFQAAGMLVNNLSFLAALCVLYFWVEERYSTNTARWATAVLAWCPLSLYCTVIYTEGLFLLCSTAALRAFDQRQYFWTAFWGALSTATRSPGLALIPAFLFASWKERRGIKAYIASLAVSLGILLYSLYCQIKFGDALAFVHVQRGWRESAGFAWQGWWTMLQQIAIGPINLASGYIADSSYPQKFAIILFGSFLVWCFRKRIGSVKLRYSLFIFLFLLWQLAGNDLIRIGIIFGSPFLLSFYRARIPLAAVMYALFTYGLILNTGLTLSVERYVYGIVSVTLALGLLLARYASWGYPVMIFFAILLANLAIGFSQKLWIA
jgi:Gpi18-like mannosyltransferase